MITPAQAVQAAADTYVKDPTWVGTGCNQSIHAVRSEIYGFTLIALRGSKTWHDWFDDFRARQHDIVERPDLGTRVHQGFLDAALSIIPALQQDVSGPYVLVGHSLGGALALLLAALAPPGMRPEGIFCFAPATPFADAVPEWIVPLVKAFRYGNDPVAIEPQWFPQVPLWPIGRANHDDPFACHHISNYVAALP